MKYWNICSRNMNPQPAGVIRWFWFSLLESSCKLTLTASVVFCSCVLLKEVQTEINEL